MVSVALNSLYGKCIGTCKQGKIFSRALGGMKEITTVGNDGNVLKRVTQTVNSEGQHTTIVQDFIRKSNTQIDRKLEKNGDRFFSACRTDEGGKTVELSLYDNKIPNFFRRLFNSEERDKIVFYQTISGGVGRAQLLRKFGNKEAILVNSNKRTLRNGFRVDSPLEVPSKLMTWLKNAVERF